MAKKNKKPSKAKLPVYNKKTLTKLITDIYRKNPSKILNYKQITAKLEVNDPRTIQLINEILNSLTGREVIEEVERGKFKYSGSASTVIGTLDMTRSGAAFLVTDDLPEDIYIDRQNMNRALHGDKVEVYIFARKKKSKSEGEVIEIIKRAKTDFVGILEVTKNHAFLNVSERRMPYDIFIPIANLNGGLNGQKAIARITDWETNAKNPTGKIVDVLGEVGENNAEMHAILAEFGLPYKFPEKLDKLAESIDTGINEQEISKREDFRHITTFTIDPADAKDFDDALSFRILENKNYEIGVHIADVSHYVEEGSEIDKEAYKRATSVYLVDRTVPMLPERISNFICSLRPNEEKLTYSVIFEINETADVIHKRFVKTVINSDRRFTYAEAQDVIETGKGDFADEILKLNELAEKLRQKRFKEGAISFERSEVKFEIDENGKPLSIYFKEAKEANKLIEEYMLLANKYVAEKVGKPGVNKKIKTFVYRVHDEPDLEKLYTFSNYIKRFGYDFKLNNEKEIPDNLNKILLQIKGKPEEDVISQLAVRSMSKAIYSTDAVGHYGLAFDWYTHFTSPIRRYPDLMVHRLLHYYLNGGASVSRQKYEDKCKQSSYMEQLAVLAERASVKYKQIEFLQDKLGSFFDAVITGITEKGIYSEIIENKIEGMISIRDLDDDYYIFDEKNFCLTGQKSNRKYQLGDVIKIQLIKANLQERLLDFTLAD